MLSLSASTSSEYLSIWLFTLWITYQEGTYFSKYLQDCNSTINSYYNNFANTNLVSSFSDRPSDEAKSTSIQRITMKKNKRPSSKVLESVDFSKTPLIIATNSKPPTSGEHEYESDIELELLSPQVSLLLMILQPRTVSVKCT